MIALGIQRLSDWQECENQLENQDAELTDDGKRIRHAGSANETSQPACIVETGPAKRSLVLGSTLARLVLLDDVVAEDARRLGSGQILRHVRPSEVARIFVDASLHLVGARERVPVTLLRKDERRRAVGVIWTDGAVPSQTCRMEVVLVRVAGTTERVVAVRLFVDRAVADLDFQSHALSLESLDEQRERIYLWFDEGIAQGYVGGAEGDVFVYTVRQERTRRSSFCLRRQNEVDCQVVCVFWFVSGRQRQNVFVSGLRKTVPELVVHHHAQDWEIISTSPVGQRILFIFRDGLDQTASFENIQTEINGKTCQIFFICSIDCVVLEFLSEGIARRSLHGLAIERLLSRFDWCPVYDEKRGVFGVDTSTRLHRDVVQKRRAVDGDRVIHIVGLLTIHICSIQHRNRSCIQQTFGYAERVLCLTAHFCTVPSES